MPRLAMLNVACASVKADEVEFMDVCKKRVEEKGGKLKVADINKAENEMWDVGEDN
jgi:hypothetical protein